MRLARPITLISKQKSSYLKFTLLCVFLAGFKLVLRHLQCLARVVGRCGECVEQDGQLAVAGGREGNVSLLAAGTCPSTGREPGFPGRDPHSYEMTMLGG